MTKLLIQPYGPAHNKSIAIGILTNDTEEARIMHNLLFNYGATNTANPMQLTPRLRYVLSTEKRFADSLLLMNGWLEGFEVVDAEDFVSLETATAKAGAFKRKNVYRRNFIPKKLVARTNDGFGLGNPTAENLSDHDAK